MAQYIGTSAEHMNYLTILLTLTGVTETWIETGGIIPGTGTETGIVTVTETETARETSSLQARHQKARQPSSPCLS